MKGKVCLISMTKMDGNQLFLESYLGSLMSSPQGNRMKKALETTISDQERCLGEFRTILSHCENQLSLINRRTLTKDLMTKKRAFEEEKIIVNVAALAQQCSYEIKGYQLLLYYEKNENSRARIITSVSLMMYEWCEKLLGVSGKELQDIAKGLLTHSDIVQINIARKGISDFFKSEKQTLYDIRNNVGAHRDVDFMKQMDVIDSLSWSDTLRRFHEFEKATLEFGKALTPLRNAGLRQIGGACGVVEG